MHTCSHYFSLYKVKRVRDIFFMTHHSFLRKQRIENDCLTLLRTVTKSLDSSQGLYLWPFVTVNVLTVLNHLSGPQLSSVLPLCRQNSLQDRTLSSQSLMRAEHLCCGVRLTSGDAAHPLFEALGLKGQVAGAAGGSLRIPGH